MAPAGLSFVDTDARTLGPLPSSRHRRPRFARLAACLVSAAVLTYMLAGAHLSVRAQEFVQKDVADQVAKADAAVGRCDVVGARREIANLKKLKEGLDAAAKTGFVAGADKDAKALEKAIRDQERSLADCKPGMTVTGADGETYGLEEGHGDNFAKKAIADAQKAARECDREAFKAIIEGIRKEARRQLLLAVDQSQRPQLLGEDLARPFRIASRVLEQLAKDLEKAEAELFKHCDKPRTTVQPGKPSGEPDVPGLDDEPAKPTPGGAPKPGGERPGVPPKPGEPPKAPTTAEPVIFFGTGGQFDGVKETTLGTLFVPGNDRAFLRSPTFLSGVSVAGAVAVRTPALWNNLRQLGLAMHQFHDQRAPTESLIFRFGFSHSSASASASTGPGDTAVLTLLQPFSGATVVGFGQADASVDVTKNVYDVRVIDRLQINPDVHIDLGAHYVGREIEMEGALSSRTVSGFTATQQLRTFDNYVGVSFGLGYRTEVNLGPAVPRLLLHADAWLGPSLRVTNGEARQHVVIPGAAAPFNDFSVSVDKSRTGFALLGGFNATAKVPITPNVDLGLGGSIVFNTAQSHMVVPISPGQQTRLDSSFQWSGNVQLKVIIRFR